MKRVLALLSLTASLSLSSIGFADEKEIKVENKEIVGDTSKKALTCTFSYFLEMRGLQAFFGLTEMDGKGIVNCRDLHGNKYSHDAYLRIKHQPLAARISAGFIRMRGESASFGINGSIDDVFGGYEILDFHLTVGVGMGGEFAIQDPRNGARIGMGVKFSYGVGAIVGASTLILAPANLPELHGQGQRHSNRRHFHSHRRPS